MIVKNGLVLNGSFELEKSTLCAEGGYISESASGETVDAEGCYVLPGLVDIHTHGCGGADASRGSDATFDRLSLCQGNIGVTSFCATTMTCPLEQIEATLAAAGSYIINKKDHPGARMVGVYLEGPFINVEKKGAQRAECVLPPSRELFERLQAVSQNNIRIAAIAPEVEGGLDFIRELSKTVNLSVAHTTADYDTAKAAFAIGARHVTHLFNAMPPFTHRAPGVVGAAFDGGAVCELICDGVHIHPSVIRACFGMMPGRINLVSDSTEATGMPEGEYDLGGQRVYVRDRTVTLADGTIAGSATNLTDGVRNCVRFGIPLEDAVRAASLVPAGEIGLEGEIGSLEVGKRADFILLSQKDLALKGVFVGGRRIA
ncbi:MAG: N-acetylglucosamine-6-phosphate deacetylase [Clostridia bacterium]|nr:N-acetylglucosamine-6-phosphate deacetylase [Clostridia bacterium]